MCQSFPFNYRLITVYFYENYYFMTWQSKYLFDLYNRLVLKAALKAAGAKRCWVIVLTAFDFWWKPKMSPSSLNHLLEVALFFLLLKTVLYNWGSSHDADLIRFIRCLIGLCHAVHNDSSIKKKRALSCNINGTATPSIYTPYNRSPTMPESSASLWWQFKA